jgi:hypothetical protein
MAKNSNQHYHIPGWQKHHRHSVAVAAIINLAVLAVATVAITIIVMIAAAIPSAVAYS